jgi:hypothetical protein
MPFFLICGCLEGSGGGGANYDYIPDVQLECSSAQAAACGAAQFTIYVGLIRDLSVDCESYLHQISANNFTAVFDASGEALGHGSGSEMVGYATRWVNFQGNGITDLEEGDYRICAFIDKNGNAIMDNDDAVGEGQLSPGVTGVVVDDWFENSL